MDVEFADSVLQQLETDDGCNAGHGVEVVRGFRKTMRFIRAARDERDFVAMRGLRFEKLKGNRGHQHSFRINDQWRLVVQIEKHEPKNIVHVIEIVDYH
jgi:proteic killer suppression protein